MGTRASFWVGNPMELDKREWLGCVALDGYPEGIGEDELKAIDTEQDFRALVLELSKRNDFANPKGGWPYPWDGDIFLTDYTYAFFDNKLQLTCFHTGFETLAEYTARNAIDDPPEATDTLPSNVPAPKTYDPKQPDSIIIIQRLQPN